MVELHTVCDANLNEIGFRELSWAWIILQESVDVAPEPFVNENVEKPKRRLVERLGLLPWLVLWPLGLLVRLWSLCGSQTLPV